MNLGQETQPLYNQEDLELLKKQLKKAIDEEDYEQAAVLNKLINASLNIVESGEDDKENNNSSSRADAESRAIRGVEEKRAKSYWQGKELVDDSQFSQVLNNPYENNRSARNILKDQLLRIGKEDDLDKVDRLVALYNLRDNAKLIGSVVKENFDSIWQPYREEAGLFGKEYEEYKTFYKKQNLNEEQIKNLNNPPTALRKPLDYWQNAYDNSRLLIDLIEETIKEIDNKSSK
jgi:hypothetical protein